MTLCTQCGAQCPEDASFCEYCGFQLSHPTNPPEQAPAPQATVPPPPAAETSDTVDGDVMSVGAYLGTILPALIPLIGFVICLVWAIGARENRNRKNLARAILIVKALFLLILIVNVLRSVLF